MTDLPGAVDRALEAHDSFAPTADGYALETTVFEAIVTAAEAPGERDGAFHLIVDLPSLSAATHDPVDPVVEDGWFETLERRLADVFSVARTSTHEEPRLERDPERVRVVLEYVAWDAEEGVDDAKTLIEYVEGTYAQGIIPGYEYRGAAATLLESAQQRGQQADGERGGTPL
ncbi:DUF5813 family protein [Natrononativus amylolyticus]|uniref:DUF5813 family protein n=1 Tax=Natrononativus amylolyticus TaxID=2963434 RepID=UPI0020CE1ADF|nr:DUF5813 family protein [Natrononativus amylolyticus]